jgi:hypothetical protein
LAAVLSGTLALELAEPFGETSPAPDAVPALARDPSAPGQPSRGDAPAGPADADTAAILARPLFAPSRRAPPAAASLAQAAVAEPPRLAGVIFSPSGGRAIFASDAGRPAVVGDGGSIGGYVVKSITPDMVLLAGPGGERGLRITYDPKMRVIPHVLQAANLDAAQ